LPITSENIEQLKRLLDFFIRHRRVVSAAYKLRATIRGIEALEDQDGERRLPVVEAVRLARLVDDIRHEMGAPPKIVEIDETAETRADEEWLGVSGGVSQEWLDARQQRDTLRIAAV